jgi:hypothetical protein
MLEKFWLRDDHSSLHKYNHFSFHCVAFVEGKRYHHQLGRGLVNEVRSADGATTGHVICIECLVEFPDPMCQVPD